MWIRAGHPIITGIVVLAVSVAGVGVQAGVVRPLTELETSDVGATAIDDSGSLVVAVSSADPFGTNPGHAWRLLALTGPATGSEVPLPGRIANDTLSITDDGTWIYFVSPDDLVGSNPDYGRELFRVQPDGSNLTQITNAAAGGGRVIAAKVAGGGSNVLIHGTIDPVGTNTAHDQELFVLALGGGTYTQLTTAGGERFNGFDISDNGTRIVFSTEADLVGTNPGGTFEIYTVFSSGGFLIQRTDSLGLNGGFVAPAISGNGQWMACHSGGTYARPFGGGGGFTQIDTTVGSFAHPPSITDDGSTIVYTAGTGSLLSIPSAGGTPTQLTAASGLSERGPVVSGDGTTIAFLADDFPASTELARVDSNGGNRESLLAAATPTLAFSDSEPHLTPDGERIVFTSSYEQDTGTYIGTSDLFRLDVAGGSAQRLTTLARANQPMLSGDGNSIVFLSDSDLIGANACGFPQVFGADADGGGVIQLTTSEPSCNAWNTHPVLAQNADLVVYQGTNGFFSVPPGGGTAVSIDAQDGAWHHPRVSDDGAWVVYRSRSDFDGLNPNFREQILRARTDGSMVLRVTADPNEHSYYPDISGDGQRIVYDSAGDPLGTNPEGNREIWLFDVGSGVTTQLTSSLSGDSTVPRISADGNVVWFRSRAQFAGSPGVHNLYRTVIGSGVIERVGGLADPLHGQIGTGSFRVNPGLTIDADGDRAVFSGSVDATGTNSDRNTQLFFVDLSQTPSIHVGTASPTLVWWDVEPSPWRYDVIRGDVADLSGGGGSVDLGPVVCLEDESLDARTAGDEDALQPAPGQVLFYLYRGAELGGPGSWGAGSDGSARVPGSGDCPS